MKKYLSLQLVFLFTVMNTFAQFSDENFIYTETPQKPVQAHSYTTLSSADIIKSIRYFDGLGRLKQTIEIGQGVTNNLLDWKGEWTLGTGGTLLFNKYGQDSENIRIDGLNPFRKNDRLWRCVNDALSDADGGWNTLNMPIDKTKSYVYAVWVKRTGGHDGTTYHGVQNVVNLDNTANSNPYFWSGDLPLLDVWYLMVGLIHSEGYMGGYSGISGLYDSQGVKVAGQYNEFKWSNSSTVASFGSYLNSATDVNVSQYFYAPKVQQIEEGQANVLELLRGIEATDIVIPIEYDDSGRKEKEYLPYATSSAGGVIIPNALSGVQNYYNTKEHENTTNPFSKKEFEASPLDRVLKQAAPGNTWALGSGHEIKFEYQTNTASEVKLFIVSLTFANNTFTPTLEISSLNSGYFEARELYKSVTYDENWISGKNNSTEEFKDKQGRVILKRTYVNYDVNSDGDTLDSGEQEIAHDTYYVYDHYGNLTYVLPPKMNATTTDITAINSKLDDLGYQYKYDNRNRLVEKKLPGKGLEYIVYDKLDRPVLTQDTNLKTQNKWLFTKYDAFGRIAYTGTATNAANATRATIQDQVNTFTGALWVTQSANVSNFGETNIYYNNGAYPNDNGNATVSEIYTINYYDSYVDRPVGTPNFITIMESPTSETNTPNVKGLLTTNKVKVLDITGSNVWATNLNYYDSKARPVYTYSENTYLGTVDIAEMKLDFTGKPLKTKTTHIKDGVTIGVIDNFIYDPAGRLKAQTQCIGDQTMGYTCLGDASQLDLNLTGSITGDHIALRSITVTNGTISPNATLSISSGRQELIVLNNYDELGQLKNKKVGGSPATILAKSAGLQTVDFKYNIRGWLKNINDIDTIGNDLFAFQINYNDILDTSKKLFNGNISQTQSKTAGIDTSLKGYVYEYDALNRLTNATDNSVNNPNRFNESLNYDKNGNITSLDRKGNIDLNATTFGTMDNLTYTYDSGNRLTKVEDSSGSSEGFNNGTTGSNIDYSYDANGNMIVDDNKKITNIKYNYLNLPTEIKFQNDNIIKYIYNAQGQKQKKIVIKEGNRTETSYAGNYQYLQEFEVNALPVLNFFRQPEGYVERIENSFKYVYQYKDHLGNIRLSYRDSNNDGTIAVSEILEENNYYPFGLKQQNGNNLVNSTNPALKYKYNGKELQDELGLNMYDYGARNYDPALGRFVIPDPMQELYYGINSYAYVFNNPVQLVDPTGMIVEFAEDPNKSKKENRQLRREFMRSQRELNRKSSEARANWNVLSDRKNKNVHTIHLNEKNEDGNIIGNTTTPKAGYNPNGGGGTDIYIDLSDTTLQGEELGTNIIGIGHEEGHAFRIDQGLVEADYEHKRSDPDNFNKSMLHISKVKKTEEIEASHIENIIRAQVDPTGQRIPLRQTYDNVRQHRVNRFSKQIEIYYDNVKVIKPSYNYYKKTK